MERVLRARDRVHEQFKIPQDANTMDEAHFYFDVLLLQLFGAFDAAARVAHLAYGISGRYDSASWRKPEWRKKLAVKAPVLEDVTRDGRAARDAIEIVALLRNTIHGEALQGVTLRRSGSTSYVFRLPARETPRLVAAVRRRGGFDRWGITLLGGNEYLVSADRFVEAVVPDSFRALNRIMRATDTRLLPGVAGAAVRSTPPAGRDSPFSTLIRRRLRMLGGL
jgi:hypothetical protein